MAATLRARGHEVQIALGFREAFDVIVDGFLVYSKLEEGRVLSDADILKRIDERRHTDAS